MDIKSIVERDFGDHVQKKILEKLQAISDQNWGVGSDQLIRAILQLSKGSISKFNQLIDIVDPRDILMEAQAEPEEIRKAYV